MKLKYTILAVLTGTCLVSAYGDAWPTYHGGAGLLGFADTDLPETLQRKWIYNTTGRIDNTPVSDGSRIFAAPGKGRITALSLEGNKVWEKTFSRTDDAGKEVPLRFDAPLLCHEGLVLAGSSRGLLIALESATGEERWRLNVGGMLLGSPNCIDEERIVVLDQGSGTLHGISVKTGTVEWTSEEIERCDGSPGVGQHYIAFGSCLAALHVYHAKDGEHLRDIEAGDEGEIAGGVAVDGHQAWFGTRDGRLLCANLEKGTIVWTSSESAEQTFSTPAVADKQVVYTSDNGYVYAVDRSIGRTLWNVDTGGMPGSAVIAGDKVLVPVDGSLMLLSLTDGALLGKTSVSDEVTSPALVKGLVIVGADDGTVSAWGPGTVRKDDDK